MDWLKTRVRPDILALEAYSTARLESGEFTAEIAIDANECPWPPFGNLAAACKSNRYPEPQPKQLLQRLSAIWGVSHENILLGRGSSEGIDALLRVFCRATQDNIIICPPTFGLYKINAIIQGAAVLEIPLTSNWQLDISGILKACTPNTKLIYLPSPNAPMGHRMIKKDVLELLAACTERIVVVIDEAYIEFTGNPEGLLPELNAHPHLVILRTLSKAHALAGERVGAIIAHAAILAQLSKVQAIYPLTQSSIRITLDALSANGLVDSAERRRILIEERKYLEIHLLKSKFITKVFPTDANFILVETKDNESCVRELKKFGILVRDLHKSMRNCIRITIGTPEENRKLLRALGVPVSVELEMQRLFSARRETKETLIDVTVNLDSNNFHKIDTGIGFFDHMLLQLSTHGGFGLELHCKGDLIIDQHHSVEDCALVLGDALRQALGDKCGIGRFGFDAPLDESLARVVIDLSGRPFAHFDGKITTEKVGELSSEMIPHFFQSLASSLRAAIHIHVEGKNNHHMVEASFKATGRALRQAFRREGDALPSTKGTL